ncbi:MAG: hypothetical protein ABIS50_13655 [Luteolibacter sp.]|uniref:hypothetical protein n=1 Tax=Luteolibacter sp. TaxID=1962973 RepID=UPI00326309CA
MKHLLKSYLLITAVMAINLGLFYAVLTFVVPDSDHAYDSLKTADGDSAKLERNLSLLNKQIFDGYHADLRNIINYCGVPDGYAGQIEGDLVLIYFYDRFGKEDWVAHLSLKNGFLTGIGYNNSSVNDHSQWTEWKFSEADIPTYR